MRHYQRKPGARNYRNYTQDDMDTAVREFNLGRNSLRKLSKKFNIPLGTLSTKVNKKHPKKVGRPITLTIAEEESIVQHVLTLSKWGFPVDLTDMRMIVKQYLDRSGRKIDRFKNNIPGIEWARSFMIRHKNLLTNRKCQNIKSSRAKVSTETMKGYFANLSESLKNDDGSQIPKENIFNYDETNLTDDPGAKKYIFKRGVKYPERVKDSSKTSISLMFCGNASGDVLPPYTVYKAEHLWDKWTEGGPKGARYNRSRSGWFDHVTFLDWFKECFLRYIHKRQLPVQVKAPVMIIGDNLSSHFNSDVLKLAQENNVRFICLPANCTHIAQPLDVAFFAPMKRIWRSILCKWKMQRGHRSGTISKDSFPALLKQLYTSLCGSDTNPRSESLVSGFRKCGISPLNADEVISRLPDYVAPNPGTAVSEAVVELLREMRGVNEPPGTSRRKKRLAVEPGKSVTNSVETENESIDSDDLESEDVENPETPDIEMSSDAEDHNSENVESIAIGDFATVCFKAAKTKKYYIGQVTQIEEEQYEFKFLRRMSSNTETFVWPLNDDINWVTKEQILSCIRGGITLRRGNGYMFPKKNLLPVKYS